MEKKDWIFLVVITTVGMLMFSAIILPQHKTEQKVNQIASHSTSGTIIRKKMVVQEIDGLTTYQYVFTLQFNVTLTDNFDRTYTGYNTILVTAEEYQQYLLYDDYQH